MVTAPWDYVWSSARAHALGEANGLVTESAEYGEFGTEAAVRQRRWREFLLGEDPCEELIRRGDWAIGDEAFRLRVLQAQGRPAPRGRRRPWKADAVAVQISPHVAEGKREA